MAAVATTIFLTKQHFSKYEDDEYDTNDAFHNVPCFSLQRNGFFEKSRKKVPLGRKLYGLLVEFAQLCFEHIGFWRVAFVVDEMDETFVVPKVELYNVVHITAYVLPFRFGCKQSRE